jgi:hypothetical protein
MDTRHETLRTEPPARLRFLLAAGALALLAGCAAPPSPGASAVRPLDPPAAPGAMAPRLVPAGSADGALLLTWLEPAAATGHRLRLSRLAGGRWSAPVTIAEGDDFFANWADVPIVGAAGDAAHLVAGWLARGGTGAVYDYGIQLAVSADGGATWRRAGQLQGEAVAAEYGFVSLIPEGGGRLRAFWLDGREAAAGGAQNLRTGLIDRDGRVDASEVLDHRVCDCCQTDAAVTAGGPLVVYRDRSEQEIRDISILRRAGSGSDHEWSAPGPVGADGWTIAGCPVNGPAVAAEGDRAVVAWFTGAAPGARVRVAFSGDGGARFGPAREVDAAAPLGRVDVVLTPQGEAVVSWLAGEEETNVPGGEGGRAYVRLRRFAPDGRSGAPLTLAETGAARASGFPRLARSGDALVLAWIDDGAPARLRAALLPFAAVPTVP